MVSSGKTIVLMRHAKSSWGNRELTDFERPLNARGKKAAPFMGRKLSGHDLNISQFISSPSNRTMQTAKRICKEIAYDFSKVLFKDSIYQASTKNLLNVINGVDNEHDTIILLGHNPAITYLVNALQDESYITNVPTCGMVSITFALDVWGDIGHGKGILSFYEYPRKYSF